MIQRWHDHLRTRKIIQKLFLAISLSILVVKNALADSAFCIIMCTLCKHVYHCLVTMSDKKWGLGRSSTHSIVKLLQNSSFFLCISHLLSFK